MQMLLPESWNSFGNKYDVINASCIRRYLIGRFCRANKGRTGDFGCPSRCSANSHFVSIMDRWAILRKSSDFQGNKILILKF